jgi:hypothetical protein
MDSQLADMSADDALIGDYMTRVRRAAWYLPRQRRELVIARIGFLIADELDAQDVGSQDPGTAGIAGAQAAADTAAVLAGLGDARELVRAVDGHLPGAEARCMEFSAVALLLIGALLWGVGWLVGVALLWASPRWRWQDKLLATLVWPGGLLVTRLLMVLYGARTLYSSTDLGYAPHVITSSTFSYLVNSTLGHPPLRHLAVLLAALAPPVIVAIRLLRRARQPEQPQPRPQLPRLTVPGAGTDPS